MEEFVPFEISKKLKEKGFKEECVAHYHSNDPTCLIKNTALADYVQQPFCIESIKRSWNRCELNPCSSGCYYDAPTISQVLKWLRKEKSIICLPHIEPIEEKWFFYVVKLPQASDFPEYLSTVIYNTYEEAALAGIEFVLDNLI